MLRGGRLRAASTASTFPPPALRSGLSQIKMALARCATGTPRHRCANVVPTPRITRTSAAPCAAPCAARTPRTSRGRAAPRCLGGAATAPIHACRQRGRPCRQCPGPARQARTAIITARAYLPAGLPTGLPAAGPPPAPRGTPHAYLARGICGLQVQYVWRGRRGGQPVGHRRDGRRTAMHCPVLQEAG